VGIAPAALAVAASLPAASAATPRARANGRDDAAWLQARLDASGGVVSLPKLPGGQCYAVRGFWVRHYDTQIVSSGACITALGAGPVPPDLARPYPVPADAVGPTAALWVPVQEGGSRPGKNLACSGAASAPNI